ncbi:ribosomal RNA small subunit methyltransferase [Acrasis kona]|uniref:Ribosomal RNA small subunit methyltransferase n=1 Tax=Acrasis kona TaxID=1008807 RepID=A0AAW2Z9D2_9EUKA
MLRAAGLIRSTQFLSITNPTNVRSYVSVKRMTKLKSMKNNALLFKDTAASFRKKEALFRSKVAKSKKIAETPTKVEKRTPQQKEEREKTKAEKLQLRESQVGVDEYGNPVKISFVERHVVTILYKYYQYLVTNPNAALDIFISNYLRHTLGIGMHNRHTITNTVFEMVRWQLLLQHIMKTAKPLLERPLHDIRKQQRLHTNNMRQQLHDEIVDSSKTRKKLTREKRKEGYLGTPNKAKQETLKKQLDDVNKKNSEIKFKQQEMFLDKQVQEDIVQMRLRYNIYKSIKQKLNHLSSSKAVLNLMERLRLEFVDYNREDKSFIEHLPIAHLLSLSLIYCHDAPVNILLGCPAEFFDSLVEGYGKETAIDLCIVNNTQAPIHARINPLKNKSRESFMNHMLNKYGPPSKKLQEMFEQMPEEEKEHIKEQRRIMQLEKDGISLLEKSPLGVRFSKRHNFRAVEEYQNGFFEVQDEASQLVSALLDVKPGDLVLDYCCGAGGKTLAFAHKMQGKGTIHMTDIREEMLIESKKRLRRAGIENVMPIGVEHPHLQKLKNKMDWILVDVPCSGTGTIRRNPEIRFKVSQAYIDQVTKLQREIFDKALAFLRMNGGKIVYSTCSVLKVENDKQIEHFKKRYKLDVVDTLTLLPEVGKHDGMFACVMEYPRNVQDEIFERNRREKRQRIRANRMLAEDTFNEEQKDTFDEQEKKEETQ